MKSKRQRTFCEKEFNRQEVQLVWEQSVLNRTPFASEPKRKTREYSRVNFGLRRSGQPTNKRLKYPHISQQSRHRTKITVPCNDASAQGPEDKLGDPVVGASPRDQTLRSRYHRTKRLRLKFAPRASQIVDGGRSQDRIHCDGASKSCVCDPL